MENLFQLLLNRLAPEVFKQQSPLAPPIPQKLWDEIAKKEQDALPEWKKRVISGLDTASNFVSGILSDPTTPGPYTSTAEGIGAMLGALPFAPKGIKGLYSRVEKIAESLPEKIHPNKLGSILRNRASQEEVQWRGLDKLIQEAGDKPLTKESIIKTLHKNPLDVNIIQHYNDPMVLYEDHLPPQYDNYQIPGAKNYREDLIQLPLKQNIDRYGYIAPDSDAARAAGIFKSHHWDEPNILVHIRHNERRLPGGPNDKLDIANEPIGPKIRMLENVQSDWEQRAIERGYYDPNKKQTTTGTNHPLYESAQRSFDEAEENLKNYLKDQVNKFRLNEGSVFADEDLAKSARYVINHLDNISSSGGHLAPIRDTIEDFNVIRDNSYDRLVRVLSSRESVPNMPFKDKTVELALKQQLSDIAYNRPDLEGLGIVPSKELRNRGEVISSEYQDVQLPKTLEKLLTPFGGKVETVDLGTKGASPHINFNPRIGRYGGFEQVPYSGAQAEPLVSVLPGEGPSKTIIDSLYAQQPTIKAPVAMLTPEILAQIREKGFPLLTLLLLLRQQEQAAQKPQ